MSRKYVRNAAAQYFAAPQIPGIGRVYPSPPKISKSSDAYENLPAGTPSGSVLYVEVLQLTEKRLASGGPTLGTKETRYNMRLHLLFRSREGRAEDAMDDHDDQIEDIMDRLRADRTLGTNGRILQSGQDIGGIVVATGLPKAAGIGSTWIWSLVQFDVVETITA